MAMAAMAGSILAGWAVEAGRYRPRRWVRASCWAVAHTDSSRPGARRGRAGRAAGTGCGLGMLGGSSGLGEDQQVGMDLVAAAQAGGSGGGGMEGEVVAV